MNKTKKLTLLALVVAMFMAFSSAIAMMMPSNKTYATDTTVTTETALSTALTAGGEVVLGEDILVNTTIEIPAGVIATLDLAGYKITSGYQDGSTEKHIYPLEVYGNLTVKDSGENGSITGRGIYVQTGSKFTLNSGAVYGIDSNGGSALYQYGGDIVINGGLVEQKVEGTSNFAINAAGGTVTVYGGKIAGNHGAIAAVGAIVVIYDGEFICTGTAGMTDNVLYSYGSGSITIHGGTFVGDDDGPSGGCCIYDANGAITVNSGNFSNSSGGDVWGTTGTVINGGSFENLTETSHVTVGSTITNGGKVYTKTENGLEEATFVAKIGDDTYDSFDAALEAASDLTGDVIVELYGKVTLNTSLSGSYDSIKFVGKTSDAEIYLDVQGYITATGKNVSFEDLNLSKSAGGYITNAGFMNVAFGVYDVKTVTYTNCYFVNGSYASGENTEVTYIGCTFMRSHDKYGLWAYGASVFVDDCTFADYRGIKMYAEGAAKTTAITVKNSDFSKLTDKPAIVLTYGESVTLEGNTYSSTGTFELDLDGAPNGTPIIAPASETITCKNDNGACGVLVDGKIYTTVAQAAEVATAGSTVTLLHNSAETVELAEGVTLEKNGYTADGVTVKVSVPTSTLTNCYTSETGYWGECGGNASESFVFKFYNGDTYMGYTSLNNVDGIIDGDVNVSWNIKLDAASNTDEYWTMEWDGHQPTIAMQPTRVEHWVDGAKAAEATVEPNWPDRIFPVVAAVTDADGKILSYVNNHENATLANAFANGGNIVLLSNVTLTEKLNIPADVTVTLDLNGKTIDGTGNVNIAIATNGDLTVKDSTEEKAGTIKAGISTGGNAINVCGGTFTLESGNVYSLNNALLIDEETATVNIKDGKITAEPNTRNSAAFYVSSTSETEINITGGEIVGYNGILLWNNTTINMSAGSIDARGSVGIQGNGTHDNTEINISGDASITGYYAAIYHPQGGKLSISENATLTGWTGVVVKGGTINISGGTISGTGAAAEYKPVSSGFIDTGDALYVEHYDNSTNSENYGTPVVTVTGGTFKSANGSAIASYENSNNAANGVEALEEFVSNGTFESAKEMDNALAADGLTFEKNADGTYGVVEGLKGEGTKENPYLISSLKDLKWFRDDVNGGNEYKGEYVKLTVNIDLATDLNDDGDQISWKPIGDANNEYSFQGIFDGDNHTISNLYINRTTNWWGQGLFGEFNDIEVEPTIKNLTVDNANITAGPLTGVIVGDFYNTAGTIDNVHVTGKVEINGLYHLGGIAGRGYFVNFSNCSVIAEEGSYITGTDTKGKTFIGGITGYQGNGVSITNCTVKNIALTGYEVVGAISGIVTDNTLTGNVVENVVLNTTRTDGPSYVGLVSGCYVPSTNAGVISGNTFKNVTINGVGLTAVDESNWYFGANYTEGNTTAPNVTVENNTTEDITNNFKALVANIGENYYTSLQDAIDAAAEGDTILILAGEISEGEVKMPETLKNVIIKGADAHASILKDMKIMACDGNSISYEGLTFDGIAFDNSRISITGWRNSAIIKDIIVTNCTFSNIKVDENSGAIMFNVSAGELENVTVTGNVIDGITGGESAGIYGDFVGTVNITGNKISNVSGSGMVIGAHDGATVTVTGNVIEDWGKSGNGRAFRGTINGNSTITFNSNVMINNNAPEEFAKVTGTDVANATNVDKNYWNGRSPVDENVINVEGEKPANYYAEVKDENAIDESSLITIKYVGGTFAGGIIDLTYAPNRIQIASEVINLYAENSVVLMIYDKDGNLIATTSWNKTYPVQDVQTVSTIIVGSSSSWLTVWENEGPRADQVPAYGVLWVDDIEMNSANIQMRTTGNELPIDWATIEGVKPVVASIGEVNYLTLEDALAAAQDDDVVTLLANVKLTEAVRVNAGKKITLDLNGFSITADESNWTAGEDALIVVKYGADLTITDTSEEKTGIIDGASGKVLSAIKMTEKDDDASKGTAILTVNAGTIKGYYYGISGNGSRNGTEINISGGSIIAVGGTTTVNGYPDNALVGNAIFHPQNGKVTITGGTIEGPSGIEMRSGELYITDGTITATGKSLVAIANASGNTVYGAAVALSQHSTAQAVKIEITSGTLSGINAFYQGNLKGGENAPSTNISATIAKDVTLNGKVEATESGFAMTKAADGSYELTYTAFEYTIYTLTLDGTIGINFYVDLSAKLAADKTAYATLSIDDVVVEKIYFSTLTVSSNGYYKLSTDLMSYEMNKDVTVTIYSAETGEDVAFENIMTKSIRDYAMQAIKLHTDDDTENYNNPNTVALMKSMLNYGAQSQIYFSKDVDDLANKQLDENDQVINETAGTDLSNMPESSVTDTKGDEVDADRVVLMLESATSIRIYLNVAEGVDASKFTVTGASSSEIQYREIDGSYYVEIEKIMAYDIDTNFTIEIKDGDNTVISITYSVMKYIGTALEHGSANMKTLAMAMNIYNQAANVYFN